MNSYVVELEIGIVDDDTGKSVAVATRISAAGIPDLESKPISFKLGESPSSCFDTGASSSCIGEAAARDKEVTSDRRRHQLPGRA